MVFLSLFYPAWAEKDNLTNQNITPVSVIDDQTRVMNTLKAISKVQENLRGEIKSLSAQVKNTSAESDKTKFNAELNKLAKQLSDVDSNFEKIATGVNATEVSGSSGKKFSISDDIGALLEPIIKEMRHMTADIRQKSKLRDEIAYYEENLPQALIAVENVTALLDETDNRNLKKRLQKLLGKWERRVAQLKSGLHASELQLEEMNAADENETMAHSIGVYLKNFFQKRGLYLLEGVVAFFGIFLVFRLLHKYVISNIPGYRRARRDFRIRLFDLLYRLMTVALAVLSPMIVFYIAEDWVLFSLGLLFLFGLGWTLRYTIPRMWQQVRLMLNIGSVREGERIVVDGLPWKVSHINVFCALENPVADMSLRIPIETLVGMMSRPIKKNEPWFPCKVSDWVILEDGVRGKVIAISHEMIELVERGGAHKIYQTKDFLGLSPRNLSRNFRLKETIGISYALQGESTTTVLEKMDAYIREQIINEGYQNELMNLRVEFAEAAGSSLNIVIIADFKGSLADLYNRLRRSMQRWAVDACSKYDWEIPFTQVVIHEAVN
jgi:hypothetical protein